MLQPETVVFQFNVIFNILYRQVFLPSVSDNFLLFNQSTFFNSAGPSPCAIYFTSPKDSFIFFQNVFGIVHSLIQAVGDWNSSMRCASVKCAQIFIHNFGKIIAQDDSIHEPSFSNHYFEVPGWTMMRLSRRR